MTPLLKNGVFSLKRAHRTDDADWWWYARLVLATAASLATAVIAGAQPQSTANQSEPASREARLAFYQTRYVLQAGERVPIVGPQESLDFVRNAKGRTLTINGARNERSALVIGPAANGDDVFLAASLAAPPGDYVVTLSARSETGEARTATLSVVLNPPQPVPSNATSPPLILLNGWKLGFSSCPISSGFMDTFGSLPNSLTGMPVIYFFDNCVECPNCTIEELGTALGQVLNLIRYDTGALVPQVDAVGHSMGGLIIRSYLAGLQTDGSLAPPANARLRKVVLLGTPNFGSFKATTLLGSQTAEMVPASPLLWYLSTWNQGSDDLRGVDALAIIGNKGSFGSSQNASDGVVSVTSASLGFARDNSRTRVLPYCHIDSSTLAGAFIDCTGNSIAKAPETWNAIQSFLSNTNSWTSIGATPASIFGAYGGLYVGAENSSGQYLNDLTQVKFGNVALTQSSQDVLFSGDFLPSGQAIVTFSSSSAGSWQFSRSASSGTYASLRLKLGAFISSVGPLRSTLPQTVASGAPITINGYGFGQQRCTPCQVTAFGLPLQVLAWGDQSISVNLPAYNGVVPLTVQAGVGGQDSINIMAAPVGSPVLSITKTHSGNFTQGQQNVSYTVTVSNALSASPTSGVVSVTDTLPAGLVFVSMAGAGWNCTSNACSRSDILAAGTSYPSITVTVNVLASASSPEVNQVTVSGGGSGTAMANDSTTILMSSAAPPFGSFDTPLTNTNNVVGAVGITGWALDSAGVIKVDIYRDPVAGESGGNFGLIFIGTANFVAGSRPDVQMAYPSYPNANRAGWGYQLLTNFLPNGGNGMFKLHAFAYNAAGSVTELTNIPGQTPNTGRTIICTNSSSTKPFGTIDTPDQGGTASGNGFINFGWALTPPPNGSYKIPVDGSTITVYIDGTPFSGHPTYNQFRNDIAMLFPGYTNSNGAIGYYTLDTTKLANGVHSIAWIAYDNAGRGEGLGSRFFTVANGAMASYPDDGHLRVVRGSPGWERRELESSSVTARQMERLELHIGEVRAGHLVVQGERQTLPAGSTLDPETGVFYWQIVPPFFGDFDFEFVRDDPTGHPVRLHVRVVAQSFQ